jgi:hypothetical protein
MIFSTTEKQNADQPLQLSYVPVDPKYLYPQSEYPTSRTHGGEPLFANNNTLMETFGLEQLLNQRREINLVKSRLVFSEIYQRYKLREDNVYRISLDQCTCRNLIYELGDIGLDKRRLDLERQIIGLEQEKRKERASYFRDVLFLRKELRESLIEKLEEEQRAGLLMNQGEGLT